MKFNAKKTALYTAVALSAAFAAQSASAALITTWDYTVNSTYSDFTESTGSAGGSVDGSDPNGVLGGHTRLEWGVDGTSAITVDSEVNGSGLITNDDPVNGATVTHENEAIDANSTMLDTFALTTQLDLTAAAPSSESGTSQQVGPITFKGFFKETYNEDDNADCLPSSTSNCDDIFVLTNSSGLDAVAGGQSFTIDDYRYTVFLDLGPEFGPLSDAQCGVAGADNGCVGFTTTEDATSSATTNFRIVATEVPEPGTLALLGLGLVGFGYARRRGTHKA